MKLSNQQQLILIILYYKFTHITSNSFSMLDQNQLQSQINKQNKQKYLSHPYTLLNLLQTFNASSFFNIAVSQIFVKQNQSSQNMTFGVQAYGIKLMKSKDNLLRVLYYSLLCYLFQLKQHFLTVSIKNKFVYYVLNNLKTILPSKYDNDQQAKISKNPFLTTSQIKSAFMKFMQLLQKKQKQCKMIIQQLNCLPQMDFIFLSIFKSLINLKVNKNGYVILPQQQLLSLQQKIGFSFTIRHDSDSNDFAFAHNHEIVIQDQFRIRLIDRSNHVEEFIIEKYQSQHVDFNINNCKLIRKQTTQSVGQIQEDQPKTNQNYYLDHPDPFNAKLVVSQSTDQFDQEMNELNQLKEYINQNNVYEEDQNSQKLLPIKYRQKWSSFKLNPFSKKQNVQQTKNNQNLIINVNVQKKSNITIVERKTIEPKKFFNFQQISKERSSSKSRTKLTENQQLNRNTIHFRSFWKVNSKMKTQQTEPTCESDSSFVLQRQETFGNIPFCLSRQNTFGNPRILPHKSSFQKQGQQKLTVNANIFTKIQAQSAKNQGNTTNAIRITNTTNNIKKKEGHTSFCGNLNFNNGNSNINANTNELPQNFNKQYSQKSARYQSGYQNSNRKNSLQIHLNYKHFKNGQVISKHTLVK